MKIISSDQKTLSFSFAESAARSANRLKRRLYQLHTQTPPQRSNARQICQKRSVSSGKPSQPKSVSTGKSKQKKRRRSTSRCTRITYIAHSGQRIRRGRRVSEASLSMRQIVRAAFRSCFLCPLRRSSSMAVLPPLPLHHLRGRRFKFRRFTCLRVRRPRRCCR